MIDDTPIRMTWTEWNNLTPEQQAAIPKAVITNAPDTRCSAENVSYGNGTVKDTLDGLVGSIVTYEDQAKFTLPSTNQPIDNHSASDISGSWSIQNANLYSASENVLTVLTAGMYIICLSAHGLVNANSYIEAMVNSNYHGGIIIVGSTGLYQGSIQGHCSGCAVLHLIANTTIKMQAYSSDSTNELYGTSLSSNNWVTITKLS